MPARAFSIEITILQGWWDQHARKQPRLLRPENLPEVWAPAAATNPAVRTHGVLGCTGNTCPGGNDVARELAVIRDRVEPRFLLTERTVIELAKLPECVDRTRPCVLHVTAHSHDGALFLTKQWRADLRTARPPGRGSAGSPAPPLDPRTQPLADRWPCTGPLSR